MKSKPFRLWILGLLFAASATAQNHTQLVTAYQYYFDTDPGVGLAGNGAVVPITPTSNFSQTVSISTPVLSNGLHHLFVRALDEFGKWSVPERSLFYVQPNISTQTVVALEYFYDNDPGVGNGTGIPISTSANINAVFPLGVSCLTTGTHYLYVRAKDEFERWSIVELDTVTIIAGIATPVITPTGPVNICTGNTVTLSSTNAAQGFSYQWLESGNNINGATNATYIAATTGNYSLKVTCGANFSISNVVSVTVNPLTTFYADADGDAYGVTSNSQTLCVPTGIYTATVGGDCNDTPVSGFTIHPNAAEICNNGIDDNCNGQIDEGCCNILLTETHVNVFCRGANTGSIDLSIANTAGIVTYNWSNGATTQDISTLTAGTYTVTVTDGNTCTASLSVSITQPLQFSILQNLTHVLCYGNSTGAINLTPLNGTPPYSFLWNDGTTTEDRSGLAADTYSVIAHDACNAYLTLYIVINQNSEIIPNPVIVDLQCHGDGDGEVEINASGGVSPYTYLWFGGSTNDHISNLSGGTYTVTITDGVSCSRTHANIVYEPTQLVININNITHENCFGESNGSISISPSGGMPSYQYIWNDFDTNEDRSNLSAGIYTISLIDDHNCLTSSTIEITEPTLLVANCSVVQNVNCFGEHNGSATVAASDGSSGYTYLWSTSPTQATITATGLGAGVYTVTVTDTHNCTKTCSVEITQPTLLVANCSVVQNVNCFGEHNGSATVAASDGSPGYTYLWSTSPTQATITATGLGAGVYTVTVTDAHNCTKTCSIEITEPTLLIANCSVVQNVNCFGEHNGSATVAASDGSPGYTYLWSSSPTQATPTATGLGAGVYTVTVTDSHNCSKTCSVEITQPTLLVANCSVVENVNCFGEHNGSATVAASDGSPNYTYLWSTSPTQATITATGLGAGVYTVTVTDAHYCTKTCSIEITQPALLVATPSSINVKCKGDNSGSASVAASGGSSPYTYIWNTGVVTPAISNVYSGNYSVTVTDAHGCTKTALFLITQPATTLIISLNKTNVRCGGTCKGSIVATPTGGVGPYTYLWNNGVTTSEVINLCASTYTVTVTDGAGCIKTRSTAITQNPTLITVITPFGTTQATVSVSGGVSPFTYIWNTSPQQLNSTATGLLPGHTYKVKITDNKGCTKLASITMPASKFAENNFENNLIVFPNPSDGLISLLGFDCNNCNVKLSLTDMVGKLIYQSTENISDNHFEKDFSNLQKGIYLLMIQSGDKIKTVKLVME